MRAFVLLLLVTILFGRDNPFFPVESEQDILFTADFNKEIEPLNRATLQLPPQARVLQKITVSFKNLDGSIENKSIELNHAIDWHLPLFISQSYIETKPETPKEESYRSMGAIEFAKFYVAGRKFKLETKDQKIRDFLLVNPHKIVIDLKRDASLKSQTIQEENSVFKKVRIGNHRGYYRVVIELDGTYRYSTKEYEDGYIFEVY